MPYKNIEDRRRVKAAYMRRKYRRDPVAADAARRKFLDRLRSEVNAYLIEKGCAICGYRDHPAALQFDHIVPRFVTGEPRFLRLNSRADFIAVQSDPNRQVLCRNCHAIKTAGEQTRLRTSI